MCGNNIERYRCGHSIFAGINYCPDYFRLTADGTPLCMGINSENNAGQMNITVRHQDHCDACVAKRKAEREAKVGKEWDKEGKDSKRKRNDGDKGSQGRIKRPWREGEGGERKIMKWKGGQ
ncbi:hypothetical protein B0T20DRAFT_390119 [Sordaria brevicollis]|uniref:Uncharacterized protein n=1 Tax=Sordaria brevicollis TaxID=83679 RepID=A0AAE0UFH7_SORBR|nr:hypothetical protein B0T20DRAFT_390119 [Sordaria brevicollis]